MSATDLTVIDDALLWVRAHPEMFFSSGRVCPHIVLSDLLSDILAVEGAECIVRQHRGWYVIGSNVDWLQHSRFTVDELFERVVAAPEHGAIQCAVRSS